MFKNWIFSVLKSQTSSNFKHSKNEWIKLGLIKVYGEELLWILVKERIMRWRFMEKNYYQFHECDLVTSKRFQILFKESTILNF